MEYPRSLKGWDKRPSDKSASSTRLNSRGFVEEAEAGLSTGCDDGVVGSGPAVGSGAAMSVSDS